jgi:perosamine synthetase
MARVVDSGWLAQGHEVEALEDEVGTYLGLESGGVIAVSSGSAALFMSVYFSDAQVVGVPNYACASLRQAVALANREARFIDCIPNSANCDYGVATTGTSGLNIAVSTFGIPVDLADVTLPVIDDISQALGATANGRRIGTRGLAGICSLSATKIITAAGQGAFIATHNDSLLESLRDYRAFDARDDEKHRFNFQMTDMQAAVARVQLTRLGEFLERRQTLFDRYLSHGLALLGAEVKESTRYRAVLVTQRPQELIARLDRAGVKAIVPYEVHELPCQESEFANSLFLARHAVSLPLYPTLDPESVDVIARIASEYQ